MKAFNFYSDSRVIFGAGRLNELGEMKLPGTKALLVTTNGNSVKKYGYLDKVKGLLEKQGVEYVLYDKIIPNPTVKLVDEGAALAKETGCDFIVALGGGSPIDASKMIAIMCKNPGTIWDYIGGGTAKGQPVQNGALPIVAINTTAGTGSEIDPWAVTTNEETNEKIGWGIEDCFPKIVIEDPELTVSVPATFTAYQGMDTFFHLAECYISSLTNDFNDIFSLKGIELIAKYLPRAVADGNDMEARSQVMFANMLGGYTQFISGCVSQHAMEHAMSGAHQDLTHGVGLLLICDEYFEFFADKPGYGERYANMAKAMGVDVDALPESERAMAFVQALKDLKKACGVGDLKPADYGMSADEAEDLAKLARSIMPDMFVDPGAHDVYQTTEEETASIFRKALSK